MSESAAALIGALQKLESKRSPIPPLQAEAAVMQLEEYVADLKKSHNLESGDLVQPKAFKAPTLRYPRPGMPAILLGHIDRRFLNENPNDAYSEPTHLVAVLTDDGAMLRFSADLSEWEPYQLPADVGTQQDTL